MDEMECFAGKIVGIFCFVMVFLFLWVMIFSVVKVGYKEWREIVGKDCMICMNEKLDKIIELLEKKDSKG